MTENVMMNRLLTASQVILEMTDNRDGEMLFLYKLRIQRYQYGLRGLPVTEIEMALKRENDNWLRWAVPAGRDSYDRKAWDRIFKSRSEEDILYYLKRIYEKLTMIAELRGLTRFRGQVFQLPTGTH